MHEHVPSGERVGLVGAENALSVRQHGLGTPSWRVTHFGPAVLAAGLGHVTPKDLRATHGTWVADKHGVMAAAKRLGHSNASVTTRHYARAVEARDAEVADGFGKEQPAPDDDDNPDDTDD